MIGQMQDPVVLEKSVLDMRYLYVCRRQLDASGPPNKGRILVREAKSGEPGARSFQEAFRQAKKVAGWRREIPAPEVIP